MNEWFFIKFYVRGENLKLIKEGNKINERVK